MERVDERTQRFSPAGAPAGATDDETWGRQVLKRQKAVVFLENDLNSGKIDLTFFRAAVVNAGGTDNVQQLQHFVHVLVGRMQSTALNRGISKRAWEQLFHGVKSELERETEQHWFFWEKEPLGLDLADLLQLELGPGDNMNYSRDSPGPIKVNVGVEELGPGRISGLTKSRYLRKQMTAVASKLGKDLDLVEQISFSSEPRKVELESLIALKYWKRNGEGETLTNTP